MSTYLLTWNPEPGEERDFSTVARKLEKKRRPIRTNWSTGKRKRMFPAEPVFLLWQGREPRGIFGCGRVAGIPMEGAHWKRSGERAIYVDILIEDLVDPNSGPLLGIRELKRRLPNVNWEPRASGQRLPPNAAAKVTQLWRQLRGGKRLALAAAVDEPSAFEGELRQAYVTHRSRESGLRQEKLLAFRAAHGGRLFCEVPGCGFDFGRKYGDVASEYAQVHHLKPLGVSRRTRTRLQDLAVVCANCHAVIHLGGQCRTPEEVGHLIRRAR